MNKTNNIYLDEKTQLELKYLFQSIKQKNNSFESLFRYGLKNPEKFFKNKGVFDLFLKYKEYFNNNDIIFRIIGEVLDISELSPTVIEKIKILKIKDLKDEKEIILAIKDICLDKDGGRGKFTKFILPNPQKYFEEKGLLDLYNRFKEYLHDEEKLFRLLYDNNAIDKSKIRNAYPHCCICKKLLKFKGIKYGYNLTCSKKCENELSSQIKLNFSDDKKTDIIIKRKKTCLENFGYECSLQHPEVKQKTDITMMEKYGCLNPMLNEDIKEKWKQNYFEKTGYENPGQDPNIIKKRNETINNIENFYENRYEKNKETRIKNHGTLEESYKINSRNSFNTYFEKTGFINPSHNPEVRNKIRDSLRNNKKARKTKEQRGLVIPLSMKKDFSIYRSVVDKLTSFQVKINNLRIKDIDKRSRNFPLDHIFSVYDGFLNSIPAVYIAHWTNLRIITISENSSKCRRSDKTREELFRDFFREENKCQKR